MNDSCKWCPGKRCSPEIIENCSRRKQFDFYEGFFKEKYDDIDDALNEINKKKKEGKWTSPAWE